MRVAVLLVAAMLGVVAWLAESNRRLWRALQEKRWVPSSAEQAAWVLARREEEVAAVVAGVDEDAFPVKEALLRHPSRRFPEGYDLREWRAMLDRETSRAFLTESGGPASACDRATVVARDTDTAKLALRDCGFAYFESLFEKSTIERLRLAIERFLERPDSAAFRYPCQGEGRVEHMLPFEAPFNETTGIHHDPRIVALARAVLGDRFKLELMTVINSTTERSAHQRWHQGWRYLFSPEERLPTYAIIVTVPLVDVSVDHGPTQICAGHKLRFYRGFRCYDDDVVAAATHQGDVAVFDYKTLHRGPANNADAPRPMISMVFSRAWMVNAEAYVNRAISLEQTIHLRRYWEQYFWHPPYLADHMVV
ncbi:hypothetical protein CTAYLR_009817 [Chrysophaeum taylorii]|uniref:Phytanoyl-CoA dioxygenase family protein n=1 Tax=Chrysophaeum taylorii TaxID=2483200 RepID=A0AAD7U770_9STRA|nr:hypothetical protein CTAYLR_009817 [Chrysophaeum taylorii]